MSSCARTLLIPLSFVGVTAGCGGGGGSDTGTPPSAVAIAKASGDGQAGSVGQPLGSPLLVLVTDGGTPSGGVTVGWSTGATGGAVDPASAVTGPDGIASTSWTLGTAAGPQTVQATLTGASGSPVTFSASAFAGPATALEKLEGDNQSAPINTQLPAPLQAKAADQFGNGVAGVEVSWAAEGGAVSSASVPTNSSGISLVVVTLGDTPRQVTITAAAEGLTGSPLSFSATASSPPSPATTISVVNNSFLPSSLTVAAGTTVTWSWNASARAHNVVPDDTQPTTSGGLTDGPHTYQFTFNTPGTYRYYCANHGGPNGFGMSGTVIVN